MHKLVDDMQTNINIPILHIADPTAQQITDLGISRVGLLATCFTMQEDFYKNRLTQKYGLDVIVPDTQEPELIHSVIYDELCLKADTFHVERFVVDKDICMTRIVKIAT